MHAMTQAALVWGPNIDAEAFVTTGSMGEAKKVPLSPEMQAMVDAKVTEFYQSGKLTV